MLVKDAMTENAITCSPGTNLAEVVELMWTYDIGFLPLVDDELKAIGVVTDRDICIAVGTRPYLASEILAAHVTSGRLFYCYPEDDVHVALQTMEREKVRRIAVLDEAGHVVGILSLDDIALHAEAPNGKPVQLSHQDVSRTLRAVSKHEVPAVIEHQTLVASTSA
ncbi:MAG TPA: CBS domain-containing protein [Blastocatellia bacterium]|nr:CBS domain-containing protein [Blastocatellia bacterium]